MNSSHKRPVSFVRPAACRDQSKWGKRKAQNRNRCLRQEVNRPLLEVIKGEPVMQPNKEEPEPQFCSTFTFNIGRRLLLKPYLDTAASFVIQTVSAQLSLPRTAYETSCYLLYEQCPPGQPGV